MVGHFLSIGSTQLPSCHGLFSCGLTPWLCLNPKQFCDGVPDCHQDEDEEDGLWCGDCFLAGDTLVV